jgi:small multidrug resistance pump
VFTATYARSGSYEMRHIDCTGGGCIMKTEHWFLGFAVLFEAMWAVSLKVSRGFSVHWATAVTVIAYVLSLLFLNVACKRLDISLAYAVWTGSGAALVALVGVLVLGERLGLARGCGLSLVVGGVALLIGCETGTAGGATP